MDYQNPYRQPGYQAPAQPAKSAKPWVVAACIVAVVALVAVVVSCVLLARSVASLDAAAESVDVADVYEDEGDDGESTSEGYTLDELYSAFGAESGTAADNTANAGVYVVGVDLDPGIYYLEGSQDGLGWYYTFDATGDDTYTLDDSVVYVGNYMVELAEGDVIMFEPPDSELLMFPVEQADVTVSSTLESGLYRVGEDIPAGTYLVSASPLDDFGDYFTSAAYVMSDLEFLDDSITGSYDLSSGGTQSVVVEDGDYLELFGATAELQE